MQLAVLMQDKMEDVEKAREYYKKGLELAVSESQGYTPVESTAGTPTTKETLPVLKIIQ